MRRIARIATAMGLAAAAVPLAGWAAPAATPAEEQATEEQATEAKLKAVLESLHPATGAVPIGPARATLALGKDYYFIPADEAKRVIVEGWGNPPETASDVIGMVFPAGKTFLDDSWGAVITYEASGYVSDDDAKTADYDALMTQMKEGTEQYNQQLAEGGFQQRHIVGWAERPAYDAQRHSVVWAREIRFDGQPVNALNYDVRLLGRAGVLSLNMVSSIDRLSEIREAARSFAGTAAFDSGFRYADFDPDLDKKAGYGIAGLVAAGVGAAAAKKVGLLAAIALFGKKFIVIILGVLAAGIAWLWRRFGTRGEE